jgi:hypothetical protein
VKSIANPAEDVTHNPSANNNVQTPAASGLTPETTSDRNQDKSGKTHSFSCKLARDIQKLKKKLTGRDADNGSHEAIVIKYLANRVGKSKNDVAGKKWFYIKIKDLKKHYPYLSASALLSIVHTLEDIGYCEIANHNKYKYDRTFWYHVPERIRNAAEEELRYFNSELAAEVGVPAAVFIDNFQYWLGQCIERGVEQRVRMSPRILVDLMPFSERTIKRGLKTMEDKNYASKLSETMPIYAKPIIKSGPNQISLGPNQIQVGPDQISVGPNQSNDTYYKPINNPLETSSKEKTPSSFVSSAFAENNDNEQDYSRGLIPAKADEQGTNEMGHELGSSGTNNVIPPSTHNISRVAEDVKGVWPHVNSLEELHSINRTLASQGEDIEKHPKWLQEGWTRNDLRVG